MGYSRSLLSITLCAALSTGSMAFADPKPKGAKKADAQTVANYYAGKTQIWKSCKGGIYYGANFEAQSFCRKDGDSIGKGKWSVKKGKLCADMVWYWKEGDSYGSKPNDKPDCINHLIDAEGKLWRNWDGDKDWWHAAPKSDNTVKGFKFKNKIKRLAKKWGV